MTGDKKREAIRLINTTDLSRAKIAAQVGVGVPTLRRWFRGTKYALDAKEAIPVEYDGVTYPSIREASFQTGVSADNIKRATAGLPEKKRRSIPVIFEGEVYDTISAAVKATGRCQATVVRNGVFGAEALDALERKQQINP